MGIECQVCGEEKDYLSSHIAQSVDHPTLDRYKQKYNHEKYKVDEITRKMSESSYKGGKETRECIVCENNFKIWPSVPYKTCSKECADKARSETLDGRNTSDGGSVTKPCANCGEQVERWQSQSKHHDNHFCDRYCLAEWKKDVGLYPVGKTIEVEGLNHIVRSNWEKEIALLLKEHDIDYEYEGKSFNLSDRQYTPDFIIGDIVIEVKGIVHDNVIDIANEFMEECDDYTYIVIGSKIPADIHINYENKNNVIEVLEQYER